MDFRLPDDHVALGELASTILREHTKPDRLGRLEADGGWFDRELWAALASSGLLGIALSSDVGGGGLDPLANHVVLREVGATAAHAPVFESTVLAARVVDRAGTRELRHAIIGGVVEGSTILAAAIEDEVADVDGAARPNMGAEAVGDGFVLRGVKVAVSCASLADHLVVTARTPDGATVLVLVDTSADGVLVEPVRMPTDVPHSRVTFDGATVAADRVLATGEAADGHLADLLDHARVGLASMQAGLVSEAVQMAASHTSTREQFGRAIATFQAVRQRVADARIASEMLDLTSLQAAWLLSEVAAGREVDAATLQDAITIAKWWACEAGHVGLHAVHHVHGGIGVDQEYPLHRLFGRAKSHEFALGNGEQHLRDLGRRIAASSPEPANA